MFTVPGPGSGKITLADHIRTNAVRYQLGDTLVVATRLFFPYGEELRWSLTGNVAVLYWLYRSDSGNQKSLFFSNVDTIQISKTNSSNKNHWYIEQWCRSVNEANSGEQNLKNILGFWKKTI